MESPGRAIDFQLKIALSDSDFLALVRDTESANTYNKRNTLLRLKNNLSDERAHTDIVARYSTGMGTLSLTGMLHERIPINFTLKPGSRSHGNFLRLLYAELSAFSIRATADRTVDAQALQAATELRQTIEDQITASELQEEIEDEDALEVIDLYRSDFEPLLERSATLPFLFDADAGKTNRVYGLRVVDEQTGKPLLQTKLSGPAKQFRLFSRSAVGPQLISGFFGLETELDDQDVAASISEPELIPTDSVSSIVSFVSRPEVVEVESGFQVYIRAKVSGVALEKIRFGLHWGTYGSSQTWVDEECIGPELSSNENGDISVVKLLSPEEVGEFGLCAWAAVDGLPGKVWSSDTSSDDVKFLVNSRTLAASSEMGRQQRAADSALEVRLLTGLSSFKDFVKTINHVARQPSARRVGRILFELTAGDESLRSLVSSYYVQALAELESGKSDFPKLALSRTSRLLQNIGIGEVVLVSPEGPHAIAGGLAQVIVGLSKAWAREGISCTIISPLYEQAFANQHRSADELIRDGVQLVDRVVPLKRIGEIRIPFGATRASGKNEILQSPRVVPAVVYSAEYSGIRVLFLRHSRLADRLYHFTTGEDQLRKAIFLSRGALELVRDGRFGIFPDLIISNDWLAALIPALLKTDQRYRSHSRLAQVETIHAIHNAGPAFQGRFFVNQFGEDLWPLVGVSDEHFFGLADPGDKSYLNLTAGAILHSSRGVLTVSKPYAQQLLTSIGGEGLESVLRLKRDRFFGISNGVDLQALRETFHELGEEARASLGLPPVFRGTKISPAALVRKLPGYKASAKTIVQKKFGLELQPDAVLFSMVGRLTEQKGIQLLSEIPTGESVCVMESLLRKYPRLQFLFVGPLARVEAEVRKFEQIFLDVQSRYPNRVRGIFNFIPHRQALEITYASDFFLMPSRYEPGGITQLESMAAGTLVVGHRVGGIAATLEQYNPDKGTGTSFLFDSFSGMALRQAMLAGLAVYENSKLRFHLIGQAAFAKNDWSHRSPKYLALLQHAGGALQKTNQFRHLDGRRHLLDSIRA